jgi:hypothetical protein
MADVRFDARYMPGADDSDNLLPLGVADGMGQIFVPFIDKGRLQGRELFPEGLEGHFEDVLLLELLYFFFRNVFGVEKGDDHLGKDPDLCPESHFPPGPQECDPYFPVRKDDDRPHFLRFGNGPDHFFAGSNAELFGNLLLERGQKQLEKEDGGPLLPDHLDNIHFLPFVPLLDGLIAGLAEFYADGVGTFRGDNRLGQFGALPGNMSDADENQFFAFIGQAVYIGIVQSIVLR